MKKDLWPKKSKILKRGLKENQREIKGQLTKNSNIETK